MYTLHFPFRLAYGQEIKTEETTFEIGQKQFRLMRNGNWYFLTIDRFQSEDDAKAFKDRLWAGFMWVLLNIGLAPEANLNLQQVTYAENLSKIFWVPIEGPVDGLFDVKMPGVYLSDKRLRKIISHDARVIKDTPAQQFFQLLQEYFGFPEQSFPLADPKLQVALDLYVAYFNEYSANARFLTLVMCLEALTIGTTRPQPVLDLLKKWQDDVEQVKLSSAADPETLSALDSLNRELDSREVNSIRNQIRNLVLTTLRDSGASDAEQAAKTAVKIYGHRSKLVHTGVLKPQILNQAISDAKSIAERVLRTRFLSIAHRPGGMYLNIPVEQTVAKPGAFPHLRQYHSSEL